MGLTWLNNNKTHPWKLFLVFSWVCELYILSLNVYSREKSIEDAGRLFIYKANPDKIQQKIKIIII